MKRFRTGVRLMWGSECYTMTGERNRFGYHVGVRFDGDAGCFSDAMLRWDICTIVDPDPWESADGETQEGHLLARKGPATGLSSSVPPPQASEGPTARPGASGGGGRTTSRVRVGQVWKMTGTRIHNDKRDPVCEVLRRSEAVMPHWVMSNHWGMYDSHMENWTLIRDVEEPCDKLVEASERFAAAAEKLLEAVNSQDGGHYEASRIRLSPETLEAARRIDVTPLSPVEVVPARPIRPGQRYSDGRHEYAFLDEDSGTFLARRDDGLRVLVPRSRVVECAWRLVSGPVEVETDREASRRVVELEMAYPPVDKTPTEWRRLLMGYAELLAKRTHTPIPVNDIRLTARNLRGWHRGPWEGAMTLEEAGR